MVRSKTGSRRNVRRQSSNSRRFYSNTHNLPHLVMCWPWIGLDSMVCVTCVAQLVSPPRGGSQTDTIIQSLVQYINISNYLSTSLLTANTDTDFKGLLFHAILSTIQLSSRLYYWPSFKKQNVDHKVAMLIQASKSEM